MQNDDHPDKAEHTGGEHWVTPCGLKLRARHHRHERRARDYKAVQRWDLFLAAVLVATFAALTWAVIRVAQATWWDRWQQNLIAGMLSLIVFALVVLAVFCLDWKQRWRDRQK